MTGAPTGTPEQHAATRLATLTSDGGGEWAQRLMSGDMEAVAEFNELFAKALGIEMPPGPTVADNARAELDRFTSDPSLAKKLFAGDADVNRRLNGLNAAVANGTSYWFIPSECSAG